MYILPTKLVMSLTHNLSSCITSLPCFLTFSYCCPTATSFSKDIYKCLTPNNEYSALGNKYHALYPKKTMLRRSQTQMNVHSQLHYNCSYIIIPIVQICVDTVQCNNPCTNPSETTPQPPVYKLLQNVTTTSLDKYLS